MFFLDYLSDGTQNLVVIADGIIEKGNRQSVSPVPPYE
jgi:hypothetical protein